jgi:hypothetical protein
MPTLHLEQWCEIGGVSIPYQERRNRRATNGLFCTGAQNRHRGRREAGGERKLIWRSGRLEAADPARRTAGGTKSMQEATAAAEKSSGTGSVKGLAR